MKRKRLAVARLWFEGNAFSPVPVDLAAFESYEWLIGPQVLEVMRGTATELGAVAKFSDEHPEWEVVVLRCAAALPAGHINAQVFDQLVEEVLDGLRVGIEEGGWDAVYLSLHGAAITTDRETPELDLACKVRELLPDVPVGASFDLHGNMPPQWAEVLDVASAYRTHPHIDMAETADRVIKSLVQCADNDLKTRRTVLNERIILPSINMRTAAGPMNELEKAAREATTGSILDISVFGGFPYSDTEYTGASVFVSSDATKDPSGDQGRDAALQLMNRVRELTSEFRIQLPSAAEALTQAMAISQAGLIAVTDSGDNPLSGGGGDTPTLFREMIASSPQVACLFASFVDGDAVNLAMEVGVGNAIDIKLGGRYGTHFGEGVNISATVERLTPGRFVNTGPMQTGVERLCGNTALLRISGLPAARVIITERVVAGDDPAFYDLHGVDLTTLRLLCVKAKNHFRAAFIGRCVEIIDCDAPGPACQDLSQLPFSHKHISADY
ncbi:M81 family metallopeptidase [Pusillimonas sp. ANT_WB101]|uniref:M81 family metallopeptidase n=1 Tax=Pusillimonas sp. ANT_WB101 TaxID=2597356 RepID=UPI0011ECA0C3|nr:M81 family metallopeptidase [Pusillimonas sp. ANT_WB101]KAA0910459.1 M81 family metallopeptidase [Pusillimonas sp. ANT_WB101]